MLESVFKYWQLVTIVLAIVGGAVSGYVWLDERFDGIESELDRLPMEFARVEQISDLARSDELQQGFDQLDGSLERVRCELDALINAGDMLAAAEAADNRLRVLELQKRSILRREQLDPLERDELEQIRLNYNRLQDQRDEFVAEAGKYRRIIDERQCE